MFLFKRLSLLALFVMLCASNILIHAAAGPGLDYVDRLLFNGDMRSISYNFLKRRDEHARSALFGAARDCILRGFDVNQVGDHAMHVLLFDGAEKVFGRRITIKDTPLAYTLNISLDESAGIARLLLERGAHVDGDPEDHYTPLMCAIMTNNLPVAKVLLEFGAHTKAKAKTAKGLMNASELASLLGRREIAELISEVEQPEEDRHEILRSEISAFSLAMHPRPGEQSPAQGLTVDALQTIAYFLRTSYQEDPLPEVQQTVLATMLRFPEQRQLHEPTPQRGLVASLGALASHMPGSSIVAAVGRSVASWWH